METSGRSNRLFSKRNLIILAVVMLIGTFFAHQVLTKEIVIQDQGKEHTVKVYFANVAEVLSKAQVTLEDHDRISQPLEEKAKNGMVISIVRAHPVTLIADGKAQEIMTTNENVKDILGEYNVAVGKYDRVEPGLQERINKYDTITVVRVNEEIAVEKVEIPFESIIKQNDDLEKGKVNVLKKGKNGEKQVKYRIIYEDGEIVAKEMIEEKITVAAENEVVEKGTAQFIATSRGTVRFKKMVTMSSSAYDASFQSTGKNPGDKHYGLTRMGTQVRPGVVAVDPKVIPLGTKLYIKSLDGWPDYGFAVAEDTGGAIKGNKIDLFFEDSKTVAKYGRRKVEVYILR